MLRVTQYEIVRNEYTKFFFISLIVIQLRVGLQLCSDNLVQFLEFLGIVV